MGWARAGHEVIFGVRNPHDSELVALKTKNASIASLREAAGKGEVVVLGVPWGAVPELIAEIKSELHGKVLIDCTNPAKQWPNMDHSAGSGGVQVAKLIPDAKVVKAFNITGFENMQDPKYPEGAATMFYAGDDAADKKLVHALIEDLGFDAVDAGPLAQSHALEVLASLWGGLAYGQRMGRSIAFRLMKR